MFNIKRQEGSDKCSEFDVEPQVCIIVVCECVY